MVCLDSKSPSFAQGSAWKGPNVDENGPTLGPGRAEQPCTRCLYSKLPSCRSCKQDGTECKNSSATYDAAPLMEALRRKHERWTDRSLYNGGSTLGIPLSLHSTASRNKPRAETPTAPPSLPPPHTAPSAPAPKTHMTPNRSPKPHHLPQQQAQWQQYGHQIGQESQASPDFKQAQASGLEPVMPSITQMSEVDLLMAMSRSTLMSGYFTRPIEPPEWMRILFPTESDLQCFHHCVLYSMSIFVLREENNPWIEHVVPLMLFPTGRTPLSVEAMRLATLATGATHLAYLAARGASVAGSIPPKICERRTCALRYRQNSLRLLRQARTHEEEFKSDAFLAATAILMFTDVLSANPTWAEVHRIAHAAVQNRGGCEGVLFGSNDPHSSMSARKCIIWQMVLLDLYSCFTSGNLPRLVRADDSRDESWFHRSHSVDNDLPFTAMCGVEESMGLLATRTLTVMAQYKILVDKYSPETVRAALSSTTPDISPSSIFSYLPAAPPHSASTSSAFSPPPSRDQSYLFTNSRAHSNGHSAGPSSSAHSTPPSSAESRSGIPPNLAKFTLHVATVYTDIENWSSTSPTPSNPATLRIRGGSLAVMYGCMLILRRQLYGYGRNDTTNQGMANHVLRLCIEVGDKVRYLNWPLICAAEVIQDASRRSTVRQIIKAFEYQGCYEIAVMEALVEETWRRMDQGVDDEGCIWRNTLVEMGCPVLIM